MILKGFKEKSIKKKFQAIMQHPSVIDKENVIENVGILFNIDEVDDFEMFKSLSLDLNILPNKIKIVAFANDEKDASFSWDVCFHSKDIGWHGKISNIELGTFLETDFDLLVSYYTKDVLELKFLTASSRAKFKVGLFKEDERLNDLIINAQANQFSIFKDELVKYLKVLKKIKHEQ